MTFLAPLFMYIGLAVAAGAVALHFIVTRQPQSTPLPTARFVPQGTVRVTTIAAPEDRLLLLLRVLLVLLVAAAFARPVLVPRRRPVLRVVLADVSRAVASDAELRDSVRAVLRPGDALVVFDSAARAIRDHATDSAAALRLTTGDARLTPALIVALRAASEMRAGADSLELVLVSPLPARAADGATPTVRALWPGRARLVRVAARPDSGAAAGGAAIVAAADDPIIAGAVAAQLSARDATTRIVRGAATAGDSAWAASGRRALVRWPAAAAPAGWSARPAPDTVGAVIAGETALVAPLVRRWRLASPGGRVIARWLDGEPAATERALGAGCIRDVAIEIPTRGDLVFRPSFGDFLRALAAPCAGAGAGAPMGPDDLRMLAGAGPLAPSARIAPAERLSTPLVPWLLGAALLLALAELLVRRGARPRWTDAAAETEPAVRRAS